MVRLRQLTLYTIEKFLHSQYNLFYDLVVQNFDSVPTSIVFLKFENKLTQKF